MIFWKLCYKISPFWAFFLEFFSLGNNLTLQDHYYTRAITLILGIERNKKIIFQWGFSCKTCKNSCEFLAPQDKILARFPTLAENTKQDNLTPQCCECFFDMLGGKSSLYCTAIKSLKCNCKLAKFMKEDRSIHLQDYLH